MAVTLPKVELVGLVSGAAKLGLFVALISPNRNSNSLLSVTWVFLISDASRFFSLSQQMRCGPFAR